MFEKLLFCKCLYLQNLMFGRLDGKRAGRQAIFDDEFMLEKRGLWFHFNNIIIVNNIFAYGFFK